MDNFLSWGLPEQLLASLERMQFITPTPIQAQVIPVALEGKDILGSAQTGTGKTGAFGIPVVAKLLVSGHGSALVIVPTRELAVQVVKMLEMFAGKRRNGIMSALLIGGEPIGKQLRQLDASPRLIVGTPGRINDHLLRGSLVLDDVTFLVLDEADRMLDMGFTPQIDSIVERIPRTRQTLLFSATMPRNILTMANKYLKDPVRISLQTAATPAANLTQEVVYVSEEEKYTHLTSQLDKREGSVIIFVKTKMGTEKIAKRLRQERHSADVIHGDLRHHKRERAIRAFRERKYRIMVATDIAARGLDIAHVKHVINYDLPQCPEDYIHRIGRTARAGAEGEAVCFITPRDKEKWNAINSIMDPDFKPEPSSRGYGSRPSRRSQSRFKKPRRGFKQRGEREFGQSSSRRRPSSARFS